MVSLYGAWATIAALLLVHASQSDPLVAQITANF
jgi:hypothetical protein